MRWKAKPYVDQAAKDNREVTRFAFWPTRVEGIDGYDVMVWLEPYTAYQEIGDNGYGWPVWRTLTRLAR